MSERRSRTRRTLEIVGVGDDKPRPPADRGGGMGELPGDRPVVQIVIGKLSKAINKAERHLVRRDAGLFSRGADVVRVAPEEIDIGEGRKAMALRIVTIDVEHMRERFTRAVDLQRFDKRAKEWLSSDCPTDFAKTYLQRFGLWRLPKLHAAVTAPTLRFDGTAIEHPGYDEKTGIYFDPQGVRFPPIPPRPTKADAMIALDRLKSLLATLDFVDGPSRSVALSAILTALLRRSLSAAPLHGFSAPVPGSGKSKIVRIAGILAMGHPPPVISLGDRSDETEKRLGALLLAGDAIIAVDNIERPIGGEFLNQLLTEPLVNVRILGASKTFKVPNVYCVFATGNNLRVIGDMTRRSLICRIDPGCERPELREFETPDPEKIALNDRAALVIAALTVMRAFFLDGRPNDVPPLGSFEGWSGWVRDPLIWLGEADPADTMERVRDEDPQRTALAAVLQQWRQAFGDQAMTAREVVQEARPAAFQEVDRPDLRQALMEVASNRGELDAAKLGRWLQKRKDRIVDQLKIEQSGKAHGGVARWRVRSA